MTTIGPWPAIRSIHTCEIQSAQDPGVARPVAHILVRPGGHMRGERGWRGVGKIIIPRGQLVLNLERLK